MKAALLNLVESQVSRFRSDAGLGSTEPVDLKSLLLRLNVLTVFRPLSEHFSGMSLRSGDLRFMLVNSNHPLCRQNFTIAHELYHLFFDHNPMPHSSTTAGPKDDIEKCADAFALMLLLPKEGVVRMIPDSELASENLSVASVMRIEHYFSTSHAATLNRLADLKLISRSEKERMLQLPVKRTAREYGYDTRLYMPGNDNLVIGDFGEKARLLFDGGKISEAHYLELLHKIGIDGCED